MKEFYAVLPASEQGNFFHLELGSAWLVEADRSYDVLHGGPSREFIVIRTYEGEGELEFPGRKLVSAAGTLLVVRSSALRRYRTRGESWRFSWWCGYGYGVEPFELERIYRVPEASDSWEIEQELIRRLRSPDAMERRCGIARFQELFWQWLPGTGLGASGIAPALEYMHYRLNHPVGMEELARRCGMSLRNFRRRFTEVTGKSPKTYWEELRLRTALGLLRNHGLTLKEVAAELEYSSSFHLSHALRKQFGASPRELISRDGGNGDVEEERRPGEGKLPRA